MSYIQMLSTSLSEVHFANFFTAFHITRDSQWSFCMTKASFPTAFIFHKVVWACKTQRRALYKWWQVREMMDIMGKPAGGAKLKSSCALREILKMAAWSSLFPDSSSDVICWHTNVPSCLCLYTCLSSVGLFQCHVPLAKEHFSPWIISVMLHCL